MLGNAILNSALVSAAVLLAAAAAPADTGGDTVSEMRAMWVARWDITSPEACRTLVKLARDYNLNTLVVQVRGRGDALYKSRLEPPCETLDPPDFDPLGMILDEGHKAGLQVHAWINANYTWGAAQMPVSPEHIVNKHPDWLMRTSQNAVTFTAGGETEGAYTCPTNQLFREFLRDIYLDVATNYDVDGVHFDFIRYPSTDYCYCDRCLSAFQTEIDSRLDPQEKLTVANLPDRNAYTSAFPGAWDSFRREQITKEVYTVYDAVKAVQPNVMVSASVFANSSDAYNHRFQDWKRWLADRKLDALFPMAYSTSTDTFADQIQDAVSSSRGIPVCAGIGSYQITAESTIEKIQKARELGAAGWCLFSYSVTDQGKKTEYVRTVRDKAAPERVLLPLPSKGEKWPSR